MFESNIKILGDPMSLQSRKFRSLNYRHLCPQPERQRDHHLRPEVYWSTDFCARTALRQLGDTFDVIVFSVDRRTRTVENTISARNPPRISLPKSWCKQVRSGLLHVIALAQYAVLYTRGAAATSRSKRVRLRAYVDRLEQKLALM